MAAMEGQERRTDKKNGLLERLHNPTELRFFLMAVVLGIGYVAIYMPLDKSIASTTKRLADAKKRLDLADEVDALRKQFRTVQSRIPEGGDTNEWMQYVLSGLRQTPLKLDSFNPVAPQALGTYQVLSLKMKVTGSFADVDRFIYWLEANPRLFRIDSLRMSPGGGQNPGDISLDLAIVGVMG
jgi:Tfp pilus assembly protein PilO